MAIDPDAVRTAFAAAVNMSADELEAWLETTESRAVGFKAADGAESVGHAAGRRIVSILRAEDSTLDEDDWRLMRKAVGLIRRLGAQEPANMVTSRWRYALMNWGHDPLTAEPEPRPRGSPGRVGSTKEARAR
jgi:hypothetical protein